LKIRTVSKDLMFFASSICLSVEANGALVYLFHLTDAEFTKLEKLG